MEERRERKWSVYIFFLRLKLGRVWPFNSFNTLMLLEMSRVIGSSLRIGFKSVSFYIVKELEALEPV